jgi:two-component system nitrogen regulation response regulator GlnG
MAPGQTIEVGDLPPELRGEAPSSADPSWTALLEREVENALNRGESRIIDGLYASFERSLIRKALAHTGGRRIEAAQLLGLGRNTLTRKIRELGMESESGAADGAGS